MCVCVCVCVCVGATECSVRNGFQGTDCPRKWHSGFTANDKSKTHRWEGGMRRNFKKRERERESGRDLGLKRLELLNFFLR